jgi:hypothetical protein
MVAGTTLSSSFSQQEKHVLEGLELEISILRLLLKRHRTSHGRTKYYRRLMMTLKCLHIQPQTTKDNNKVVSLFCDAMVRLEALKEQATNLHQRNTVVRKEKQLSKQPRPQQEEQWSLMKSSSMNQPDTTTSTTQLVASTPLDSLSTLQQQQQQQQQEFRELVKTFTHGIQQLLSRIVHASKALFWEVSRGFFLPFCTVALSALARIRVTVLYLGRIGLTLLNKELQPFLLVPESSVLLTTTDYEKYMSMFLDVDDADDNSNNQNNIYPSSIKMDVDAKSSRLPLDQESVLSSLGLSRKPPLRQGMMMSSQSLIGPKYSAKSPTNTKAMNTQVNLMDNVDDDVGISVSVGISMSLDHERKKQPPIGSYIASYKEIPTVSSSTTTIPQPSENFGMENNMNYVKSFKNYRKLQQSTSDRRDSNRSHKQSCSKINQMADGNQQRSTKKETIKTKKKKKGKGNFFDDLFDS